MNLCSYRVPLLILDKSVLIFQNGTKTSPGMSYAAA